MWRVRSAVFTCAQTAPFVIGTDVIFRPTAHESLTQIVKVHILSVRSWWNCSKARCARRLAFIVDLVNVVSVLRAENDRSAVALDTGIVRHKCVNFVSVIDGVNGIDST